MSQLDLFATLEKIEQVQIANSNRIDAADQLFCESKEKEYQDTVDLFVSIGKQLSSIKSSYINSYKDRCHFDERLIEIKEEHVYDICRYFERKYNVTLNKERINAKYSKQDITTEMVLDEIFIELGGFNFNEKAEIEIKDEMRIVSSFRGGFGGKVKGNKISLEHTCIVSHCSIFKRYSLGDNANGLFIALTHFDTGTSEADWQFSNYYGADSYQRHGAHIFEKLDLKFEKIKSIKFFKNGRVDIEFISGAAALAFAKDYCGYIESAKLA
ncbi:hypothetical protein [Paenibacillus sp. Y412MC10]|uniref:hypothetical protein n=1 Tax=Geobacillus sp. (strain Y412MC10) TaxID=481743 RepID=UPI0011AB5F61|nr:hypothetical protein [Paenibacillus sp. Y412MC10]